MPTGEANAIERIYHWYFPREGAIVRPHGVTGRKPGLVRWQKTGRRGKLRSELLLGFKGKARQCGGRGAGSYSLGLASSDDSGGFGYRGGLQCPIPDTGVI